MELGIKLFEKFNKNYISSSALKEALKDVRLFEMYMAGQLKKKSDALMFGSLYDCLLFTPEDLDKNFFVLDADFDVEICAEIGGKAPRMTNKYKEWYQSFLETAGEKMVVGLDDIQKAIDMIDRLEETGLRDTFLMGEFQKEFTVFMNDWPVRGFLDVLNDNYITDSKSTVSIGGFKRDIFVYNYDLQAYIYSTAFPDRPFFWVAQEKAYPYLPALVRCSEETLMSGKRKFELATSRVLQYLDSNSRTEKFFAEFTV